MTATDLLTTDQLAKRWHMSAKHLANMRQAKNGPPYIRPAGGKRGRVLYRMDDIVAYEEKQRHG